MGLLVVISGSSGAGKDAVLRRMEETAFPFCRVVTVTTRLPRPGEKDGADYNFISEPRFREMVQRDELLEWAEVYGNFYGVPKRQIAEALSQGQDAIVRVDVQGAATIKRTLPGAVLIFLAPEATGEYEERLKRRSTESDADLRLRVESIQKEVQSLPIFDYVVLNREGRLDEAVSRVAAIITAEKCRVKPRTIELP